MNESKEFRPPQADLNEAIDNKQIDIEQTFTDMEEASKWLRETASPEGQEQITNLLTEIESDNVRLLAEQEELMSKMDALLERIGFDQAIDLAGAIFKYRFELGQSAVAHKKASGALAEANEVAFGAELSEDEVASAQPIVEQVSAQFPNLSEQMVEAMTRRAARLIRKMSEEEAVNRLKDEAIADLSGKFKVKAWGDDPQNIWA